jgi:hypothetical protein
MYTSLYAGDTLSFDRLTLNGAIRFDRTTSSVDAITVAAHPVVPDVLPGVSAPAVKNAVVWNALVAARRRDLRPGARRKTIVRGSYASFASQLNAPTAGNISARATPTPTTWPSTRTTTSTSSRRAAQLPVREEHPAGRSGRRSTRSIPDFSAPRTHEIVLGVGSRADAELRVSASYTWRRYVNQLWNQAPPIGVDLGRLRGRRPADRHAAGRLALRRAVLRAADRARAPRAPGR